MIEWLIIIGAGLIWEGIGLYTRHTLKQADPWGSTTLTWLVVRIERAHHWTRWPVAMFIAWLAYHFLIQHWGH